MKQKIKKVENFAHARINHKKELRKGQHLASEFRYRRDVANSKQLRGIISTMKLITRDGIARFTSLCFL
jgi:hypothetical protein